MNMPRLNNGKNGFNGVRISWGKDGWRVGWEGHGDDGGQKTERSGSRED